jgi:hypothetical protein
VSRSSETKSLSQGISGNKNLDKEIIIPDAKINDALKIWQSEKVSKFAEPIFTDISPFKVGLWEQANSFSVNRIKITAARAKSLVVYFDTLNLSMLINTLRCYE